VREFHLFSGAHLAVGQHFLRTDLGHQVKPRLACRWNSVGMGLHGRDQCTPP
jgi:hypothetical protein